MSSGPIRRGQLIAPFGVGAMLVSRDGTGLITAGLDHWYEQEDDRTGRAIDPTEFEFSEWRLQELLGVDHFRMPPDYRRRRRGQDDIPNTGLTIPFLRFPRWHYCPSCHLLYEAPLTLRGRIKCPECAAKKQNWYMNQVPFVAMCDHGHIQDFPWREWVHRSAHPTCRAPMRLLSTGRATLAGQKVVCACGDERSLAGITQADADRQTTFLSLYLDDNETPFLCQGMRPWLGIDEPESCTRHIRGTLRSASNAYFASVRTSIYIPRGNDERTKELTALLENPPLSALVSLLRGLGQVPSAELLRSQQAALLSGYTNSEIAQALEQMVQPASATGKGPEVVDDEPETKFRRTEFDVLRSERDDQVLRTRRADLRRVDPAIARFFSRVMLVDKLQETRALVGFTRVFPETEAEPEALSASLWREMPPKGKRWLPAYKVHGEGLFLELDERLLADWEQLHSESLEQRMSTMRLNYERIRALRRLRPRELSPRFVLLHTFAHLLVNRLTFECGYSSASLRERLYISTNKEAPMAGVLIYTAAGDAEGTMGGLVRMGLPGRLESIVSKALESARWCSADPVCMEIGAHGGQGPDSCNLAACHNCALVPETACEEFNRFLDRGLVVGTHGNSSLGFFSQETR